MGKTSTFTAEFPSQSPSDTRMERSGDSKPRRWRCAALRSRHTEPAHQRERLREGLCGVQAPAGPARPPGTLSGSAQAS